jgi:small GTP-binding protein
MVERIRLVLVGDSGVGKTSLINARMSGPMSTKPTIGCTTHTYTDQSEKIRVDIYDTAGQERFNSLVPVYIRGANCAFLVFDLSCRDSFDNIPAWSDRILQHCPPTTCHVLIGNKCDLENQAISEPDILKMARAIGANETFRVSAKTGEGVQDLFDWVLKSSAVSRDSEYLKDLSLNERADVLQPKRDNCKC